MLSCIVVNVYKYVFFSSFYIFFNIIFLSKRKRGHFRETRLEYSFQPESCCQKGVLQLLYFTDISTKSYHDAEAAVAAMLH